MGTGNFNSFLLTAGSAIDNASFQHEAHRAFVLLLEASIGAATGTAGRLNSAHHNQPTEQLSDCGSLNAHSYPTYLAVGPPPLRLCP